MYIRYPNTGGSLSIGALDGHAKSGAGLSLASNLLYAQTADATYPGLMSTGTQTIAGAKTFTGAMALSSSLAVATTLSVAAPASPASATAANLSIKGDGTKDGLRILADGANAVGALYGYGGVTRVRGYRSAGSLASPSGLTGTVGVLQLESLGYDSSGAFGAGSSIQLRSTGTWTNASHPADVVMNVCKSGTTTTNSVMQIGSTTTDFLTLGDTGSGRDYLKLESSSAKITFGSVNEWIGNGGAASIEAHGGGNAFIMDGNGFTFYVGSDGFRFNGTSNTAAPASGALTITNGPGVSTGNPTKYLKVVIAGTSYVIPCWAY